MFSTGTSFFSGQASVNGQRDKSSELDASRWASGHVLYFYHITFGVLSSRVFGEGKLGLGELGDCWDGGLGL